MTSLIGSFIEELRAIITFADVKNEAFIQLSSDRVLKAFEQFKEEFLTKIESERLSFVHQQNTDHEKTNAFVSEINQETSNETSTREFSTKEVSSKEKEVSKSESITEIEQKSSELIQTQFFEEVSFLKEIMSRVETMVTETKTEIHSEKSSYTSVFEKHTQKLESHLNVIEELIYKVMSRPIQMQPSEAKQSEASLDLKRPSDMDLTLETQESAQSVLDIETQRTENMPLEMILEHPNESVVSYEHKPEDQIEN